MAKRRQHRAPKGPNGAVFWRPCWGQVEAKLHSKSTSKLLKFSTSFRIEFWSLLRSILDVFWGGSGSNLAPRKVSKLKRPMCTKLYYLQYETMVFNLPRGSKIEEKSMPKRLQDKIGFQEAKNHEKVSNIGSSWSPRSSQDASKSKLKTRCILSCEKQRPK